MSFATASSDLVNAVEAARALWPGPVPATLKADYENRRLVDLDRQTEPYISVDIHFVNGSQISLGSTKVVEEHGQLHLLVCAPVNSGTRISKQIMDHFVPYLELENFSLARTHAAKAQACYEKLGWYITPLVVPFWFHRLVT
jgi:hypothetical protein